MNPQDPLAFDFDAAIMARGMLRETALNRQVQAERGQGGDPGGGHVIEADELEPGVVLRG
jgi:hypothetical protein